MKRAKTLVTALMLSALLFAFAPIGATAQMCADVDGSGNVNITDLVYLVAFLYDGGAAPVNMWTGDLDGIEGINNHDIMVMDDFLFHTFDWPTCTVIPDTTFPASDDTIKFINTMVPPGHTQWAVDIWLDALVEFYGLSISIEYSCATSSLSLDTLIWNVRGQSVFQCYAVDTASSAIILGTADIVNLQPVGFVYVGSLVFDIESSTEPQYIQIQLADFPSTGAQTVFSRTGGIGERPVGVVPQVMMYAEDPDLDAYGNRCFCGERGNVNCSPLDIVDISDLTTLVNHLFVTFDELGCPGEADVAPLIGPDGNVDIADITALVNHLFVTLDELPDCQDAAVLSAAKMPSMGELKVRHVDDQTIIDLTSYADLRGIQLELTGDGPGTVTSPLEGSLDLVYNQRGSALTVGLVDLDGAQVVLAGESRLLTIEGEYEVVSAICSDRSHNPAVLSVVGNHEDILPTEHQLHQNYPNPFNPSTVLEFSLANASDYRLTIHNVNGQLVKQFVGHAQAGSHQELWDATGEASGVYFYRLQAGSFSDTKKMILLK